MTPAGTSNELDVQNGWEENTHYGRIYYLDSRDGGKSTRQAPSKPEISMFADDVADAGLCTRAGLAKLCSVRYGYACEVREVVPNLPKCRVRV